MPQRLSPRLRVRVVHRNHPGALAPDISLIIRLFLPLALFLMPGLLQSQSRATMQVAAQVLPVEPSRTALGLAIRSLDDRRPAPRYSSLARVRVEAALPRTTPALRARAVRIDFLRN